MSELILKTIFASMFLIASAGAFLTMMTLMGKPGGTGDHSESVDFWTRVRIKSWT
jgi:hypothetical protein